MAEEPDDLSAVLERVRGGDEVALAELLQRYERQLRLAARVLLGPRLRAQLDSLDLVQSVHRVLLPGLREGKYDVSSLDKLLALVRTVIRHKVIRNWRRIQRQQVTETSKVAGEGGGDSTRVPDDDPSQSVVADDLMQHVLASLSGSDRQLVELRIQGYSTAEIAQRLSCDANGLRARLSRLRQRLRKAGLSEWL